MRQNSCNDTDPMHLSVNQELLRSGSETATTAELKWAAWQWLYESAGCRSIGFEVKLEGPFGRIADVVGIGRKNVVYIVEVKSSRADLKRDDRSAADQARVKAEYSALVDSAELTATILGEARLAALATTSPGEDWREAERYKAAMREHNQAQERLAKRSRTLKAFSTKFHDPRYLACADYHCIMAPAGLISISELPHYWGLLNQDGNTVVAPTPKQVRRNTTHILRAIAKANTRDIRKLCLGTLSNQAGSPEEKTRKPDNGSS